jgi:hypothetical protein
MQGPRNPPVFLENVGAGVLSLRQPSAFQLSPTSIEVHVRRPGKAEATVTFSYRFGEEQRSRDSIRPRSSAPPPSANMPVLRRAGARPLSLLRLAVHYRLDWRNEARARGSADRRRYSSHRSRGSRPGSPSTHLRRRT